MAFPVVWDLAIIRYSLTNKQPQQRGEIHLAFAMYKNPFLTPMRSMGQTSENPSFYAAFGGLPYYNAFLNSSNYSSCFHI